MVVPSKEHPAQLERCLEKRKKLFMHLIMERVTHIYGMLTPLR